jgi:hypothetical protein
MVTNISEELIAFIFIYPEDGDDKFLRNTGNHVQDYMASHPRRPQSTTLKMLAEFWLLITIKCTNE